LPSSVRSSARAGLPSRTTFSGAHWALVGSGTAVRALASISTRKRSDKKAMFHSLPQSQIELR
jgi:hypothetical protein